MSAVVIVEADEPDSLHVSVERRIRCLLCGREEADLTVFLGSGCADGSCVVG